jgi:hypothetical protein
MSEEIPANEESRFTRMLSESKKLTALINVPDETIAEIYRAESDWEFILKVDALLEAAVKKMVKTGLSGAGGINPETVEAFIDTLPLRGRTSLLSLLKGTGCAREEIDLIDCVRRVRNGFAHDILQIRLRLVEVIKKRSDKSQLIHGLSYIGNYDEAELIKAYEDDGGLLRYSIFHGTLIFLISAYRNAIKTVA